MSFKIRLKEKGEVPTSMGQQRIHLFCISPLEQGLDEKLPEGVKICHRISRPECLVTCVRGRCALWNEYEYRCGDIPLIWELNSARSILNNMSEHLHGILNNTSYLSGVVHGHPAGDKNNEVPK